MATFDFDLSIVTWSGYDTGFLCLQAEAIAEGDHGVPPAHSLQPLGLIARPMDPVGDDGGGALRFWVGRIPYVMPLSDPRVDKRVPELAKGAICLHDVAQAKHRLTLDHEGQLAHLEVPTGSSIVLEISGGPKIEVSGTAVKVTGATSVEAGGQEQLTKFSQLSSLLSAIVTGLGSVTTPVGPGAASNVAQIAAEFAAFSAGGATQITKGA